MAGAEALDPDRLFQTGVVAFRVALGKRPLGKLDLALRIAAVGQAEAAHLDDLLHALPDIEGGFALTGAGGADAEVPFDGLLRLIGQPGSGPVFRHAFGETAAGLVEQAEIVVVHAVVRLERRQPAIAVLGQGVALAGQHAGACGKAAQHRLLFPPAFRFFNEPGEPVDDGAEDRLARGSGVEIVDVADGFKAFAGLAQDDGVPFMGLGDFHEDIRRHVDGQATAVDDP